MAEHWEEHAERGLREIAQEQVRTIEAQKVEIRELQTRVWELENRIRELEEKPVAEVVPIRRATA